jgi:hypothetical protein
MEKLPPVIPIKDRISTADSKEEQQSLGAFISELHSLKTSMGAACKGTQQVDSKRIKQLNSQLGEIVTVMIGRMCYLEQFNHMQKDDLPKKQIIEDEDDQEAFLTALTGGKWKFVG